VNNLLITVSYIDADGIDQDFESAASASSGSFGGGLLSSLWMPNDQLWKDGFRGVETQNWVSTVSNWIAEFRPKSSED
jgi:hypothetical protein